MLLARTPLATKRKQTDSRPRYEKPSSASRGSAGSKTNWNYLGMTIFPSDLPLPPKLEHTPGLTGGWLMLDHASHTYDVVLQTREVSPNVS